MKVYYSHCQAIYGTPQEARDIELLEKLGFEVVNPSDQKHKDELQHRITLNPCYDKMEYFIELDYSCDAVAFRALPDGAIPAGVAKEIESAKGKGKPIFELPSSISRRVISVEQTREYLKEIGQR